jgi:hypothetical protein
MEAIDVVGINGTDLPVEALGLGQPAGPAVRECHSEPLCDRHGGAGRLDRSGATGWRLVLAFRGAPLFSVHGNEPDFFA